MARGTSAKAYADLRYDRKHVSVIVTCFGANWEKYLRTLIPQWQSQTALPEVVISEQALPGNSLYRSVASELQCTYICTYPERGPNGESYFSKGRSYNAGFLVSSGQWLYFTDADIVPYGEDYIEQHMRQLEETAVDCLIEPGILHICSGTEELFSNKFYPILDRLFSVCPDNNCILQLKDGAVVPADDKTVLIEHKGEMLVALSQNVKRHKRNRGSKNGHPWLPTVHHGSVFCSADAFLCVVGYCEQYLVWGYEDLDIKWKLRATSSVARCKGNVFHIDHERNYRSSFANERNRLLYRLRQAQGVARCVESDRLDQGSLLSASLQNNETQLRSLLVCPEDKH